MKSFLILILGFSVVVVAAALASPEDKAAVDRRSTVTYLSPEKFTDFTCNGFGDASDKDLKYLTELFSDQIETLAKRYLATDEHLDVTFKDIDLAGRYEPERGPNFQNVRIYRDITFPRMNLSFRLLGPDGKTRLEGDRKLIDMNYNMNLLPPTADPEYRHDKALLAEWMRAEFKKKKN